MKPLRLLLAVIAAACGLVLFSPAPPASACSCVVAGPAQYVEWADTVFVGTLTRVPDADEFRSIGSVRYGFDVHRVFEGKVSGTADVTSASSGASCGLEGMQLGTTYLMFAGTARNNALNATLCGGSQPETTHVRERVEGLLGQGGPPSDTGVGPGATDGVEGQGTARSWRVFYALAALSAVVLAAVGWALSPQRSRTSRGDAALS